MLVEKKASFISTKAVWATLHAAGLVVLYQNPSPGIDERIELRAAAGNYFFDLAELGLPVEDTTAVEQVLALVEALRIPAGVGNDRKVV